VPEVVETLAAQSGPLQHPLEADGDAGRMERAAEIGGKDQTVVLPELGGAQPPVQQAGAVSVELGDDDRRQVDGPPADVLRRLCGPRSTGSTGLASGRPRALPGEGGGRPRSAISPPLLQPFTRSSHELVRFARALPLPSTSSPRVHRRERTRKRTPQPPWFGARLCRTPVRPYHRS